MPKIKVLRYWQVDRGTLDTTVLHSVRKVTTRIWFRHSLHVFPLLLSLENQISAFLTGLWATGYAQQEPLTACDALLAPRTRAERAIPIVSGREKGTEKYAGKDYPSGTAIEGASLSLWRG